MIALKSMLNTILHKLRSLFRKSKPQESDVSSSGGLMLPEEMYDFAAIVYSVVMDIDSEEVFVEQVKSYYYLGNDYMILFLDNAGNVDEISDDNKIGLIVKYKDDTSNQDSKNPLNKTYFFVNMATKYEIDENRIKKCLLLFRVFSSNATGSDLYVSESGLFVNKNVRVIYFDSDSSTFAAVLSEDGTIDIELVINAYNNNIAYKDRVKKLYHTFSFKNGLLTVLPTKLYVAYNKFRNHVSNFISNNNIEMY